MENRHQQVAVRHTWVIPTVIKPRLLTLGEQVAVALDTIHPFLDDKQLGVSLELLNPDLPMMVDPVVLKRILVTLLRNAICDSPPGGEITLSASNSGSQLVISIRDAGPGPGYSPAGMSVAFPRRGRRRTGPLDKPEPGPRGLLLAKYLAGLHGGKITAVSEEGFGTVFTVLLPQHDGSIRSNESLPCDL